MSYFISNYVIHLKEKGICYQILPYFDVHTLDVIFHKNLSSLNVETQIAICEHIKLCKLNQNLEIALELLSFHLIGNIDSRFRGDKFRVNFDPTI